MRRENQVQRHSYSFAILIIGLYRRLKNQKEYILARQILRSGTSIGANVEEAIGASSRKDFINKITIAYKEARESSYWLRLFRDTGLLTDQESQDLIYRINVLLKLLGTIQKTAKRNQQATNNPTKPLVGKE